MDSVVSDANDVFVDSTGNRVFVATGTGFSVFDTSKNVTNPKLIESKATGNATTHIQVKNGYVFLGLENGGLKIFNSSDWNEVGSCPYPGVDVSSLLVGEDSEFVYLSTTDGFIRILDVQSKDSPVEVGSYDNSMNVVKKIYKEFKQWGKNPLLYFLDQTNFKILDVSNNTNIFVVGQYGNLDNATSFAVRTSDEKKVFVSDFVKGLIILDTTNKDSISLVKEYSIEGKGNATDLQLRENTIFLSSVDGLFHIDVTTLTSPSISSEFIDSMLLKTTDRLFMLGNKVYLVSSAGSVRIFSFFDIRLTGTASWGDCGDHIIKISFTDWQGSDEGKFLLYVECRPFVDQPFDAMSTQETYFGEDFSLKIPLGTFFSTLGPRKAEKDMKMKPWDGFADYFENWMNWTSIPDYSSLSRATGMTLEPNKECQTDLWVSGDYAYCSDYTNLLITNMEKPGRPYYVGFISGEERNCQFQASGLDETGDILYTGSMGSGQPWFRIFNVSDKSNPIEYGPFAKELNDDDYSRSILKVGNYLITTSNRMLVFDVTDPENPTQERNYNMGGTNYRYQDIKHGNFMYTGFGDDVTVIDITDPLSSHIESSCADGGRQEELALDEENERIFGLDGRSSYTDYDVFDISDPAAVSLITELVFRDNDFNRGKHFRIQDSYLYVLASNTPSSYKIYDIRKGHEFETVSIGETNVVVPFDVSMYAYQLDVRGDYSYFGFTKGIGVMRSFGAVKVHGKATDLNLHCGKHWVSVNGTDLDFPSVFTSLEFFVSCPPKKKSDFPDMDFHILDIQDNNKYVIPADRFESPDGSFLKLSVSNISISSSLINSDWYEISNSSVNSSESKVSVLDLQQSCFDFILKKKYSYHTCGQNFIIVDHSVISTPSVVANYSVGSTLGSLWLTQNEKYAYLVFDSFKKIKVLDLSDKANPSELSGVEFSFSDPIISFRIQDQYIFVLLQEWSCNSIHIVENYPLLSSNQKLMSKFFNQTQGVLEDFEVRGNFLFVIDSADGFLIVKMKDKARPFIKRSLAIPGSQKSNRNATSDGPLNLISVKKNVAYLSFGGNKIVIVDILDFETTPPTIEDTYLLDGGKNVSSLFVPRDENYIYFVTGKEKVQILERKELVVVDALSYGGKDSVQSVSVLGNYLHVLTSSNKIMVHRFGDLKISGIPTSYFDCGKDIMFTISATNGFNPSTTNYSKVALSNEFSIKIRGGPGYFSPDCEVFQCNGMFSNISNVYQEEICYGHGWCVHGSGCTCKTNYYGENCNITTCHGIWNNDSAICSDRKGTCSNFDECECIPKWTSDHCNVTWCFDILSNDTERACNGSAYGGICVSPDNCVCNEPEFYKGKKCEVVICNGMMNNESYVQEVTGNGTISKSVICSGHGWCVYSTHLCDCDDGYHGVNCEMHSCHDVIANRSRQDGLCSSHGNCSSLDTCVCDRGYIQNDCSELTKCGNFFGNDTRVCSGHGNCAKPFSKYVCVCSNGYFGTNGSFECTALSTGGDGGTGDGLSDGNGTSAPLEGWEIALISVGVLIPILLFGCCVAILVFIIFVVCLILFCVIFSVISIIPFLCCFAFCVVGCCSVCTCCGGGGGVFAGGKILKKGLTAEEKFLREETAIEEDAGDIAHLNINKNLFEIDLKEIKLLKILGKGGSNSTVYKADFNGTIVAFKGFKTSDLCQTQQTFDEFEKEVSILSSLSHPNTLRFYGACLHPPRVGIVMEYCGKGDLIYFLRMKEKNEGGFALHERLRFLWEIALAMSFLHSRRIIHRDLKPENVLITNDLTSKVMDFGCSKLVDRMSAHKTTRLGTPQYMAPEITLGTEYDEKVDNFSFGVMVYNVISMDFDPYLNKYPEVSCPELKKNIFSCAKIQLHYNVPPST